MDPLEHKMSDFKVHANKLKEKLKEAEQFSEIAIQRFKSMSDEASALRKERDELKHLLHVEAYPRIDGMMELQQQLVNNYASLVPIIEMKKRLAVEVAELKDEKIQTDKKHMEKVSSFMNDIHNLRAEGVKKEEVAAEEAAKKVKELEADHKEALVKKDEEIQALKEELKNQDSKHKKEISELRKENHEKQEHLRNRIAQMQQNRSSQATSNMDLMANKLHATRAEYDAQIQEKEQQLQEREQELLEVKNKLQTSQEALRHHQLLNVVRDVGTKMSTRSKTNAMAAHAKAHVSEVEMTAGESSQDGNDKKMDDDDGPLCLASPEQPIGASRALPMREVSQASDPSCCSSLLPQATDNLTAKKLTEKRRLYSIKTIDIEPIESENE